MTFAAGTGAGDFAEVSGLPVTVWRRKLRSVGEVEALGPELEPPALGDGEVLKKRQVERTGGRSVVGLEAEIAACQSCRWCDSRCVKPMIRISATCGGGVRI